MKQQVCGLSCEFVQDNGHFLLVGADGHLKSTELAELQIQMLQANSIPRLLPLHVEELNLSAHLRYDLTARRMSSKVISASRFSLIDYYGILLAIATAIEEGGAYMLYENHFVIDEDFIFIGEQLTDIYLMYLPVKQLQQAIPLAEAFRNLALNWIGHVKEVYGDGLQAVLNYCRADTFSASGLKKLLLQVLNAEIARPMQAGATLPERSPAPAAEAESSFAQAASIRPAKTTGQEPQPSYVKSQVGAPVVKPGAATQGAKPQTPESSGSMPVTQREKIVLALLVLLGNALIWRVYTDHPGEGSLLIGLGATLLTFDMAYVYICFRDELKAKFGRGAEKDEVAVAKELSLKASSPARSPKAAKRNRGATDVEPKPIGFDKSQLAVQPQGPLDADYYNQLSMQTTLLNQPEHEKTVLLNTMSAGTAKPVPQLEVRRDGRTAFHALSVQPFVIGRGGAAVHLEDNTVGVSRMHMELQQDNGIWYAKDLGSKNGSLLNEQPMVAYRAYPLKDGDVVKIVKTEFVFRMVPV